MVQSSLNDWNLKYSMSSNIAWTITMQNIINKIKEFLEQSFLSCTYGENFPSTNLKREIS